jgi:hypothetical protein
MTMDDVLECGCRYEDREVAYAQEFVPEIDCPIHGIAPWFGLGLGYHPIQSQVLRNLTERHICDNCERRYVGPGVVDKYGRLLGPCCEGREVKSA